VIFKSLEERINDKIDAGLSAKLAKDAVLNEGARAMAFIVAQTLAALAPKERVYKIKRTPKGTRINIKSPSGKRYAFGPIWISSVKAGKGIALAKANREKLEMHALYVGIPNAKHMDSKTLAAKIAAKLR